MTRVGQIDDARDRTTIDRYEAEEEAAVELDRRSMETFAAAVLIQSFQ